jgi:membrane-associated protein
VVAVAHEEGGAPAQVAIAWLGTADRGAHRGAGRARSSPSAGPGGAHGAGTVGCGAASRGRAVGHGVARPATGEAVPRRRPAPGRPAGEVGGVTGWMGSVPALAALLLVALVLLAEAGLLIGVVLPAASLVLGLGVLAGAGLLPLWAAAATAASATVVGAALGHRAAARDGAGHLLPAGGLLRRLLPAGGLLRRLLPARAVRVVDRSAAGWAEVIGRRPVRAAATAQFVAGARTLAPRLAGMTRVPLRTVLRGTVPAALVWSSALVAAGAAARRAALVARSGHASRRSPRRRGERAALAPSPGQAPRSADPPTAPAGSADPARCGTTATQLPAPTPSSVSRCCLPPSRWPC